MYLNGLIIINKALNLTQDGQISNNYDTLTLLTFTAKFDANEKIPAFFDIASLKPLFILCDISSQIFSRLDFLNILAKFAINLA